MLIGYRMLWNRLQVLWAPKGDIQLVDLDDDYYLVKFATEDDYVKFLIESLWTIFGSYLTVQPWSREFSTSQVFPSLVILWVRLPGLPYHYYMKSLFCRIATTLGRVVKVDYNTQGGERGKFTRLAIMLDFTKPLRSCIGIDGFIRRLGYEGSQNISFGCGTYGHAKELFGNPKYAGAVTNNQSHRFFPLAKKQVDKVSHEDLFGPWMVVEDRRRRNHRGFEWGGEFGANVVAMIPSRVPSVVPMSGPSTSNQHHAVTIVEEGDDREGGTGLASRAGSKGFGKKKVQFKKKTDSRSIDRVISPAWSNGVNVCCDTPRQRDTIDEDIPLRAKSHDDPRLNVEVVVEGQSVVDMVQLDDDRYPALVVD
ncbi:hypothetical protein GQ457_17G010540 [Hibiscus cannabinus]